MTNAETPTPDSLSERVLRFVSGAGFDFALLGCSLFLFARLMLSETGLGLAGFLADPIGYWLPFALAYAAARRIFDLKELRNAPLAQREGLLQQSETVEENGRVVLWVYAAIVVTILGFVCFALALWPLVGER